MAVKYKLVHPAPVGYGQYFAGAIRYSSGTLYYCNASAWTATSAGGGGSGTVNIGSQYQMAYYSTTGTAVSGDSNITTDSSNDLIVGSGKLGIGTTTLTAGLTINGTQASQFGTNYTTTGTQNDVAIGTAGSSVRYPAGAGAATFNGQPRWRGKTVQILYLSNGSTSTLTLANQASADTTVTNQIVTGSGNNLTVPANNSVILQYDSTATNSSAATGAWRVMGSSTGASSTGAGGTTWVQIASTDIGSAVTSYTFSGLNGDTDLEYQIVARDC